MPGTLFVVATPIGNLEDITVRALRVLREVAVIAAEDTRRTAQLLARYAIPTPTMSFHQHNESTKTASLVARLARGDDIALVSDAGTPAISDPGQRLIRAVIDAGLQVEPIPGPSAVITALAASGLPSDTFIFLGFPPTRSNDRTKWFELLPNVGHTVVFFEAPHRIRETLEQLRFILGDISIVVCRELTKTHEELVNGPISSILAHLSDPKGEFTIVIGIGQTTKVVGRAPISDADMVAEFGHITVNDRLSRRRAVNALARKHRRSPNEVYAAIERGKKLVE